jgi:AraC family transcriptional regulator of adaptative response / DNA-3-methyladenine glycosylase II
MTVRPDLCYQAVRSRDARFDGRFFTGVVTTGVYCRPVCPARTPKRENVRFFPCAAAAEEAGFRPCRRCRPEAAPGTPAWIGASAVTLRALRLIGAGALDRGSVEDLAARVGIGDRHLRRLFLAHLGATPHAVANTRRVHLARRLIDETTLPMAEIALAAEFPSIRRFNAAIREAFGRTPSALRRESHSARPASLDAPLLLRLPFRPPFAWDAILRFLAARATPGIEAVSGSVYHRTIAIGGAHGTIAISRQDDAHNLLLTVHVSETSYLGRIVERVRRLFDLGADPREIELHLSADPLLRPLVHALPGIRVPGAWDGFELAVRAVLGQQVSVRGAVTLAGRLAREFGEPLGRTAADSGLSVVFPTPDALANADLTRIGLTRARAATVAAVAKAVREGQLTFDPSGNPEETVAALGRIAGIGPWTAQYIAMRALGEPDAFPDGDLGLRRAAGSDGLPLSAKNLVARAERWRPWRAYAAMLLWMHEGGQHDHQ